MPTASTDEVQPNAHSNMSAWQRLAILALIGVPALLYSRFGKASAVVEDAADKPRMPEPRNNARMITHEELAKYVDPENEGKDIWLSIMGEVYDVTNGRDYYAGKSGYAVFAGRDASVPFVTGTFTKEESKKTTDGVKPGDLDALIDWRKFYEDEDKYEFQGYLIDERWYTEDGKRTPHHEKLLRRAEEWEVEKARKKAERAARSKK